MSTCPLLAFLFSIPSLPFSGLLSISSSLWAVLWPEPCSVDCLYSSMRGSHFRSPVTIPGGAAPLWLMLYKTFFFFFFFFLQLWHFRENKQALNFSICDVCLPVPLSSLSIISPSLTNLFIFVVSSPVKLILLQCFSQLFTFLSYFFMFLPIFLLSVSPYIA